MEEKNSHTKDSCGNGCYPHSANYKTCAREGELWAKKLMFYKSKLKKICIHNTYDFMTEFLDKLYRTLVTLHYSQNMGNDLSVMYKISNSKKEDLDLFTAAFDDMEGKTDNLIWLSDYLFCSKDADKVIADYEWTIKQEEEKKLSKKIQTKYMEELKKEEKKVEGKV